MAGGINISLVANVREFLKGTRDATDSLDDVVDSLDDVAREGDTVDRELGRSMDDAADSVEKVADAGDDLQRDLKKNFSDTERNAESAADDMEKSFRNAFDDVKKESRTSTRKMGDDFDGWGSKASRESSEFKDEARSNFSEVVSSFDGDMDSMLDLAQGTFGGLAGSLSGPFALAAGGIAASAGLFYSMWRDNAEKVEERVNSMYEDMTESGEKYLSEEYIRQAMSDIITGADDAVISLEQVRTMASITGMPEGTILAAAAGDAEALEEVLGNTEIGIQGAKDKLQAFRDQQGEWANDTALQENIGRWESVKDRITGVQDSIDTAGTKADLLSEGLRAAFGDTGIEAENRRLENMGTKIDEARTKAESLDGKKIKVTPELETNSFYADLTRATRTQSMRVNVSPAFQGGLTRYGRSLS